MTENKRFTLEKFGLIHIVVDDNGKNLTARETVDLLNELAEENLELRKIIEDGIEVSQSEIDEELRRRKMSENKQLWDIMCYCEDEIKAENKDAAYKIFCKKHHFNEENAEFVSYDRIKVIK